MNRKILIIGANGFTGRHLLNAFSENTDWQVTGCSLQHEKTPRPKFSGLSIEKARRELGYNPCTFEEGVRRMIKDSSSR